MGSPPVFSRDISVVTSMVPKTFLLRMKQGGMEEVLVCLTGETYSTTGQKKAR